MEKIVVFGTGKYYQNRKQILLESDIEIAAFLDNNQDLHGKYIDGAEVFPPHAFPGLTYDKILLMSADADEMKKQLLELGADAGSVWFWDEYLSEMTRGSFRFYCGNKEIAQGKKILIVSTNLGYNGGTIAAVYAAMALQSRGYYVILAAQGGNRDFVVETMRKGINIMLCPALPYLHEEEIFWIQQFDAVLVNVFQMIQCACEISRIRPVMWWIHEPGNNYCDIYKNIISRFGKYADADSMKDINIYAVSGIAQRNFNQNFPDRIRKTLAYGIPDEGKACVCEKKTGKMIFALVGMAVPLKAQDIFIQAVKQLEDEEKEQAEFWLIGCIGEDEYGRKIRELAEEDPSVKILGLLTRGQMSGRYAEIDAVVCPSMEDSLPVVMTEGMMHGKVCIASDATGTADYITEGENGLVCRKGDANDLCKKMKWVIRHRDEAARLGRRARETYEQNFRMDKFADRLEKAILETTEQYGKKDIHEQPDH